MSWIINGVSPLITSTLMRTETAYQAWTDLEGKYKQENAHKTNDVKYYTLQQGTLSLLNTLINLKSYENNSLA